MFPHSRSKPIKADHKPIISRHITPTLASEMQSHVTLQPAPMSSASNKLAALGLPPSLSGQVKNTSSLLHSSSTGSPIIDALHQTELTTGPCIGSGPSVESSYGSGGDPMASSITTVPPLNRSTAAAVLSAGFYPWHKAYTQTCWYYVIDYWIYCFYYRYCIGVFRLGNDLNLY